MHCAARVSLLLTALAGKAFAQDEEGTGRDLLWSNPTADLPDVLLSKSVEYVTEGSTFFYTVVLTHQPGLREDLTADLGNDEVRIYLTSSQEVYQQTGPAATEFSQMLGHRTQLTIDTNYVSACPAGGSSLKWSDSSCIVGTCHATVFGTTYTAGEVTTVEALATKSACEGNSPAGSWVPAETHYKDALPYRYVPYSTVNPTQPSPVTVSTGTNYETLCPVCTHTKYCTQAAGTDGTTSIAGGASATGVFDGCRDLALTGYTAVLEPNAGVGHAAAADKYVTQKLEIATHTTLATAIDGSTANPDLNVLVIDYATALTAGAGNLVASFDGVTGIIVPKDMGPIVAAATNFAGTVTTMPRALAGTVDLKLIAAGSTAAVSALSNAAQADVIGNSDYRSEPDGYPVERDIPDPSAYCRYCNRPTLKCSANLKDGTLVFVAGDMCNMVTVNGGDQQPGALGTWTSYKTSAASPVRSNPGAFSASDVGRLRAGSPTPTWRGDVSSAAQLVFDSRNWNQPQSVKVTAFDDGVYEPNVNGRGQDAYVHHFVVAQDENLQHTYYDDIDVNDLVVSITDNDHAVAVQTLNTNGQLTPEEGYDYHSTQSSGCADGDGTNEYNACSSWSTRGADALIIKLSSEPMYDVVIYVQSGPFFDGVPAAATILPDDEQVIFQDMAQVETCFTKVFADSASLYNPTCATTALTTASACDPHGSFIAPESFMDQTTGSVADLPTQAFGFALGSYPNGLDLGDVCSDLTTETICNTYNSAGCVWSSTVCVHEVPTTAAALLGAVGGTPPTIRKSMDLVCQSQASEAACNGFEGCAWDPLGTPACVAQDKGFDCNSYVVFTSTNWAVAQTLKVIAVDDDEDEAVTLGATELAAALARSAVAGAAGVPSGSKGPWGMEDSVVGYLIASKDWYYNSDGARFMASTRTGYVPKYNSPIGFEEAGTTLSSVLAPGSVQAASVVSTARGGTGLATVFTGLSAISGVTLSMFDTRFGTHINRYPYTTNDADVPSGGTFAAAGAANGHNGLTCGTSSPMFNCAINVDSNTADANQEVCTDSTGTWTEQVNSFDPTRYTADGAICGATVHTQDNDNKGVVVSRSSCEATEGRRTYYQVDWDDTNANLAGHMKDPTVLETRFGLFLPAASWPGASTPVYGVDPTTLGVAQCPPTPLAKAAGAAAAPGGGSYAACGGVPIDYWTASNTLLPPTPAPSPTVNLVDGLMTAMHGDTLYMTMPTCPLTVQLSSSPAEGKSVVITMQEDPALAALRDHELYFYEEPTFRFLSSALGTLTTACEGAPGDASCVVSCDRTYPGSTWLAWADAGTAPAAAHVGACFINNVPIDTTSTAELFKPNGGTSIKLTFTSNDWSVGRRITIIALNDDVDEPPEARTAYFTMDTALTNDDKYDDAVFANAEVLVNVFDDDIADVVLLCGDSGVADTKGTTIGVHATDTYSEDSVEAIGFLGSYDDALGGEIYIAGGEIVGLSDGFAITAGPVFGIDWDSDGDGDSATEASAGSGLTTPGRLGYNAQDGLSHGYEHSFGGGGRPGITMYGSAAAITAGSPAGAVATGTVLPLSRFNNVGLANGAFETGVYGYVSAIEADATGADATIATGCLAGLGFKTVAEGAAQLQRCYPNTWADYDSYDPYSDNYFLGTTGLPLHDGSTATGMWNHVRGFKGVGPAASTGANNYECTIHSRECENVVAGFCYTLSTLALDAAITVESTCVGTSDKGWSHYRVSAADTTACEGTNVGSFQVRLNSSPGQKTVRRQYVGETSYTDEKELVYVVVTPDETPQTKFEPASLTFTDTGGYVNGVATQRWDKPAVFNVRPVDDDVDERRGFIVDFTAMTVTTSHLGDTYHTYTIPYQIGADTGEMHVFGDSATARTDGHTLYRHTIRTVHTLDNDWSGVTVDGQSGGATATRAAGGVAGKAFTVGVTEGGSFNYYTLQLDSQPAKIQRQAGTGPNVDMDFQTACGDVAIIAHTPVEYADGYEYFADNTYIARYTTAVAPGNEACGTVEPPADYWVDVTVTQSIHVDLAVPPTCPTTAPWGGGSTPPTAPHPRFPFNADALSYPYDEVNGRYVDMTKYLTTCGGWQRDATYRFDATNWDTPQYVYVYAHNDKDGLASATPSGSETSTYAATLKHYVETEDTTDNILFGGDFVQRNKHGGIYTWGNSERYPFGNTYGGSVETDPLITGAFTGLYDTGFTTRGFTSYESLYGYYAAGATGYPDLASACCNANMPVLDPTTTGIDVTWGALSTRTGGVIHASCSYFTALGGTSGLDAAGSAGVACVDTTVLTAGTARPYTTTGGACIPANLDDGTAESWCIPAYAKISTFTAGYKDLETMSFTRPTLVLAERFENGYGSALDNPPMDVGITVTDNDAATAQAALTAGCRQTRLFQFADSRGDVGARSAVLGDGVLSTKWLTDYNCESGDAGGLPGYPVVSYPVSTSASYGLAGTGYCTDKVSADATTCVAATGTCSVQGVCAASGAHVYFGDAVVAADCGVCATGTDRYTSAECVKTLGGVTGTWTAGTFTTSGHDSESECDALGLVWTAQSWKVHPVGSGMVAQDSSRNLQCCSCAVAFKSGVLATTLSSYTNEATCNAAAGGAWTCVGVGPHCET